MNIKILNVIALSGLFFVSCSNDDENNNSNKNSNSKINMPNNKTDLVERNPHSTHDMRNQLSHNNTSTQNNSATNRDVPYENGDHHQNNEKSSFLRKRLRKGKSVFDKITSSVKGDKTLDTQRKKPPKNLGSRLGKKLYLINHRTKSHDKAMWWALAGVVLMMIDAEYYPEKHRMISIGIRCVVTLTTMMLS